MMYEIVKRRGAICQKIVEAPVFIDRSLAEDWARKFLSDHPDQFQRGLEAIEVRTKPSELT